MRKIRKSSEVQFMQQQDKMQQNVTQLLFRLAASWKRYKSHISLEYSKSLNFNETANSSGEKPFAVNVLRAKWKCLPH